MEYRYERSKIILQISKILIHYIEVSFEYFLLLNKTNDAFLYLSSVLFIRYIYKYKTQHAKAVLAYYIFFNWVINLDHLIYFSCNTINIYLLFSDFNFPYTIHDL